MLMPMAGKLVPGEEGPARSGAAQLAASFGEILAAKLRELEESQKQADRLTFQYLAGQVQDLHQVTLALEEASLSLQLAVQVRNKVLEAYQEIFRMQL
ncbi:MAG: flagellar hook-basal body complex protein FliE [Thermoanaerobacteraceae bacterium]|nr:flagellar hook-basal body complex protein FliE [Thermoanaerobacteraceae bacterium]